MNCLIWNILWITKILLFMVFLIFNSFMRILVCIQVPLYQVGVPVPRYTHFLLFLMRNIWWFLSIEMSVKHFQLSFHSSPTERSHNLLPINEDSPSWAIICSSFFSYRQAKLTAIAMKEALAELFLRDLMDQSFGKCL